MGVRIIAAAAGSRHSVAVASSGEVLAWGSGAYGEVRAPGCVERAMYLWLQPSQSSPPLAYLTQFSNTSWPAVNVCMDPAQCGDGAQVGGLPMLVEGLGDWFAQDVRPAARKPPTCARGACETVGDGSKRFGGRRTGRRHIIYIYMHII
jgi:hypothetical protein